MKKLIRLITIVSCLVCSIATYAQDSTRAMAKRSPEQLAQMQAMQYKKKLSLTPEQETKLTPILTEYYKKMMAVKADNGRKMKKLQEVKHHSAEKDKAVKAILTEQQYTDYQKLVEEQKEKIKDRMAEKKGGR